MICEVTTTDRPHAISTASGWVPRGWHDRVLAWRVRRRIEGLRRPDVRPARRRDGRCVVSTIGDRIRIDQRRRTPDADNLACLCLCLSLGVSADYLLGLAPPDSAGAAIQLQRIRDVLDTQQPAQEAQKP